MRPEDWPEKLAEFIASREGCAFEWGAHDCALFCCDAILAMTGVDMAAEFRGRYSNSGGAARLMRGGLARVARTVAAQFQLEPIPVRLARRGDPVLVDFGKRLALGIVDLDGMRAVGPGPEGLLRVPLEQCIAAWRLP